MVANGMLTAADCAQALTQLFYWRQHMRWRMANLTLDLRVGDGTYIGKVTVRNGVVTRQQQLVNKSVVELWGPVFVTSNGTDPTNAWNASIAALQVGGGGACCLQGSCKEAAARVGATTRQPT